MKRTWEGNYTVEAVLVMSVVLMVIFSILYLAFYLHDMVCVQAVVEEFLAEKRNYREKDSFDKEIGKIKEVKKKAFLELDIETQIERSKNQLYLNIVWKTKQRMPLIEQYISQIWNPHSINRKIEIPEPEEKLRLFTVIMEGVGK